MSGEIQEKTPQRQITHTMLRRHIILINEFLRLQSFAFKNKATYFRQYLQPFRIIIIVRSTSPERLFIELQFCTGRSAKYHSPQTGIT